MMSGFPSFSRFLSSMNPRDRSSDPISHLRFVLETMPGSRKYEFEPSARSDILYQLYDSLWGPYSALFLPEALDGALPPGALLSEAQIALSFLGAGKSEMVVPGRPCGHIFRKGESCFRCK